MAQEQFANNPSSTLTGAITAGSTSLTVASATAFPTEGNFRLLIETEILKVTGVAGATFTVERGAEATTAAAHAAGAAVTQVLTAGALNSALFTDVTTKTAAANHKYGDLVPEWVQSVLPGDPHLNSLAYDGFTLVTGTFPGGDIWISQDRGLTFDLIGPPGGDADVDDIAYLKAARPGVFYAGCSNSGGPSKLYRSTDGGATWSLAFTVPTAPEATEGLVVECSGKKVLIGSYRASGSSADIWLSTDDGSTFTKVANTWSGTNHIMRQLRRVSANNYIATVYGSSPNQMEIWHSSDGGVTWASAQTIASTDCYSALALPGGRVLLGTHPSGIIYRNPSSGGVSAFEPVANFGAGPEQSQVFGLTRVGVTVLAFVSRGDGTSKVYASDDLFDTWTEVADLDPTYHYHEPLMVDWRTIVAPASHNSGIPNRGAMFRMAWYG